MNANLKLGIKKYKPYDSDDYKSDSSGNDSEDDEMNLIRKF